MNTPKIPHFLALTTALGFVAVGTMAQSTLAQTPQVRAMNLSLSALPESPLPGEPTIASGVYLFGDEPEAGKPGHEYMVFQVNGGEIVGGFYQPASEFSCFTGNVDSNSMNLSVADPYSGEVNDFRVPLYLSNQVAASEIILPFESALGLQGTYRIVNLDSESQNVLETCRSLDNS